MCEFTCPVHMCVCQHSFSGCFCMQGPAFVGDPYRMERTRWRWQDALGSAAGSHGGDSLGAGTPSARPAVCLLLYHRLIWHLR